MIEKANFGKVSILKNKTVTYTSTNWSEVSKSVNIEMYTTVPTMESVEFPTITLNIGGFGKILREVGPHLNLPKDELCNEFIAKIKKREGNKPIKIEDIDSLLLNQ